MLLGVLRRNQRLSAWANWVVADPRPAAQEIRGFLETCFANIASNRKKKFLHRIGSADADGVDSALHEMVAQELLRRFHLQPEFDPKLSDGLTPDMIAKVANQQFIVDVFLTRNPSRTIKPLDFTLSGLSQNAQYTVDSGERAKKIRDTIVGKHSKYSRTGKPMILVVLRCLIPTASGT